MNFKKKFDKALAKFIKIQKKDPKVIGILVSGSYVHSKPDPNSDIDTYVITETGKMRERGNTWVDGVEIEYFKNPVRQIKDYFKTEKGTKMPCTVHMFANGKVMYAKNKKMAELVKQAKLLVKQPAKKMTNLDFQWARYALDDLEKDLEDIYLKGDKFGFHQISLDILEYCFNHFFKVKRLPAESWLARKPKRMSEKLQKADAKFASLYKTALLEHDMKKKYQKLKKLIKYLEPCLGGKRPKEWKLVSKCTF
ncbi:nucleotidyltransferase domain-containing protein [Candidatus Woesearchaeota archaeon]|nr:nucleotidyltransferase domain-containing protein [Candidatus Woesearchaeota archaeon]